MLMGAMWERLLDRFRCSPLGTALCCLHVRQLTWRISRCGLRATRYAKVCNATFADAHQQVEPSFAGRAEAMPGGCEGEGDSTCTDVHYGVGGDGWRVVRVCVSSAGS